MATAEARPATGSLLPQELVFVDLETTGGSAAHDRITEVGIVRVAGGQVVEDWSSLVYPECRIPPIIESFTGITNAMVEHAPRFADIATRVLEKLRSPTRDTCIFAAHNARFDYSFLRAEFRRLGIRFAARVMCTVKLSRRLYPDFPRHGLDAVMSRHGLACSARHRALGDARVISDFWFKLLRDLSENQLAAAAEAVIGTQTLPGYLPQDLADDLPDGPGVYRFFGEDNVLLYIGKSQSLRTRILGHFAKEHANSKEQRKVGQTRRIDWLETAGDLGAQLTEAQWIKTQKPLYNKQLKQPMSFTWMVETAAAPRLADIEEVDASAHPRCFGIFHSRKDARKALTDISRAHSLCLKVLALESDPGSCFAFQLGKCRGACVGQEPLALHGVRLMTALARLKLMSWPFPGRIALREGASECHVLDHWVYLGTAHSDDELAELRTQKPNERFDIDVYQIMVRYLAKHPCAPWIDLHRL